MKQLVMLVTAGLVALMLSACGDDRPRQPEVKSETTVVQPAEKSGDVKKVEEVKVPANADEKSE